MCKWTSCIRAASFTSPARKSSFPTSNDWSMLPAGMARFSFRAATATRQTTRNLRFFPRIVFAARAVLRLSLRAWRKEFVLCQMIRKVQLPNNLLDHQQIFIEKQTLDVFDNPHTEKILEYLPLDAEFLVFGVVTEYCVRCAARGLLSRGRRVSVIRDAVEHLNPAAGSKTIDELIAAGAELISTAEAVTRLNAKKNGNPETALFVNPEK